MIEPRDAMTIDDYLFPPLARRYHATCFQKIKQSLSVDFESDTVARQLIDDALARESPGIAKKQQAWIRDRAAREEQPCIVVAPGPTLESLFDIMFDNPVLDASKYFIIAVDGAARRFMEKNKKLDAVVTDIDGLTIEQVIELHNRFFATILVLGHGNNVDKIQAFLDAVSLDDRYVLTTQIEPTSHVANLGGFTDGDRAIFAALALGFKHVHLLAMDLDAERIGPYSKQEYADLASNEASDELLVARHPVKERKIKIALATLKWLASHKPADCEITTLLKEPPFDFLPNLDSI